MSSFSRNQVHHPHCRNASVVADARGNTGTSNDGRDAWFIGCSPSMGVVTSVWLANDDSSPTEASAGVLATQMWGQFLSKA